MRPKSAIYTPKRDDEHSCHFYMKVPPPSPPARKPMDTLSVSLTMLTCREGVVDFADGKIVNVLG